MRLRIVCAILTASWAGCAALTATPAQAAGLPPQGLYEECAPSNQQQCASELGQMGAAGFRLALNYTSWYGNAAQIQSYAGEAQADGIKLIWPLDYAAWRDPGSANSLLTSYPTLAPECGCTTNAGFLLYVIGLVRSLPATWGYYIGDELSTSQAPAVATLAAEIRKLDPGHPLLYVGMANSSLSASLQPFEPIANFVGADVYPIGTGASTSAVGPVASTVSQLSAADGTRSAVVLQAFSWTEYPNEVQTVDPRWPTESEMQAMRDQALAANPSMILWYSIYDVLRSDDPAGHWRDLVQAAFAPAPATQQTTPASTSRPRARTASARHRHHRHHRRHRRRHHRHRHRHHRHTHRRRQPQSQPLISFLESLLLF